MKKAIIAGYILIVLFVLLSLIRQNYEFVGYSLILVPFIVLVHLTDSRFDYTQLGLWCLNAWMLSHLLGGLASIGGVRLYDFMLISLVGEPYNIFKYDQLVHMFCYFAMALLVWSVVKKTASSDASPVVIGIIVALAASGIGGINEIIEFAMVVFLNNQGVGGYHNTALDIVANFIGACIGALVAVKR